METVKYNKVFTKGILKDIEINETMKFCDINHATEWIKTASIGIEKPLFNGSSYYIKDAIFCNG